MQEVIDDLLLYEIRTTYENSKNSLVTFHDLLCTLRLKVIEILSILGNYHEEAKGIVIMPKLIKLEEKLNYLIKNYPELKNNKKSTKEELKFYLDILNEVIDLLESIIKKLS